MSIRRTLFLLVVLALSLALVMPAAYSAMCGQSSTGDDDRWSDVVPWTPGDDGSGDGETGSEPAGEDEGEQMPVEGESTQRAGLPKVEIRIFLTPPMIYVIVR